MPLQRLTAGELSALNTAPREAPYALFIGGLRVGEGGRGLTTEEGVGKAQLKNRLRTSAARVGVKIAFRPSGPDEVLFRVVSRIPQATTPKADQPEEPRRPKAGKASEGR